MLGRTAGNQPAAVIAAFGPQIDDPVCGFDDIHVVLDDQNRVAAIHQALQGREQFADVIKMQTGGGFVKNKQSMGRVLAIGF